MSKLFNVSKETRMSLRSCFLNLNREIYKYLPEKYIFIALGIRIIPIIKKKKTFGESNFESNFLGFDLKKLKIFI